MNNIEAKERIKSLLSYMESLDADEEEEKDIEALRMAIKALDTTVKDKTFAFLDGAGQGILAGLNIRKGTWIDTEPDKDRWDKSNNPWQCSCCGHRAGKDKYKTYKFCPWCGADMRKGE